jgi:aspartyl protease family protein
MRNLLMFAAAIAGAGVFMAQMADRMSPTPALAKGADQVAASHSATDPLLPKTTVSPSGGTRVSLPRDFRGHFQAVGRIEGQHINFMVDTGASVVALNEKSAAKFGLRPLRGDYNAKVNTANGTIKAARARIPVMDIGGLVVRDVEAMVLPDEALSENLLGLSFLSKLKRFEYADGRLVLEQ